MVESKMTEETFHSLNRRSFRRGLTAVVAGTLISLASVVASANTSSDTIKKYSPLGVCGGIGLMFSGLGYQLVSGQQDLRRYASDNLDDSYLRSSGN